MFLSTIFRFRFQVIELLEFLIFWRHGFFFFLFQTYEFHEISKDDYFSKNNEFSTWLKEKKRVFFSDLSADSAREMFTDFVKAWNRRKLESRYYEGAIVSAPRSAHKWKIKAWKNVSKYSCNMWESVLLCLFGWWKKHMRLLV